MARIPEEVISDIRRKARIEEVIGHYIEVQKKGSRYVAVCPFHDDHDPSLNISPDKKIFKCFVCSTAGDVFSFIMKFENVDYITAVRKAAELSNYDYDFGSLSPQSSFKETSLHKIMRESVIFCQHELNSQAGERFLKYLQKRQLNEETIEKYQFGYNPDNDALYTFLSRKGYEDRDIVAANMARLTQRGFRDVFADRLMIPVHDEDGHPIGFTARSLDPNAESKYINTAETPLFKKSDVLFNCHRAKEAIRREKTTVLAEGPMDVIAFDRAGIENAVCSMGTSCTREQIQRIHKLGKKIIMAFDGDNAGQNAIYKIGKLARSEGMEVLVLNNDTDLDPDEIVNKYGGERLVAMVQKPKTWMEFIFDYLRRFYDLNNYTSKKEFAAKAMEEIETLTDRFDRDNYISMLASLTGFSAAVLAPESNYKVDNPQEKRAPIYRNRTPRIDGVTLAEYTILKQMLASRRMCELYKQELNYLRSSQANTLALYIIDYYHTHDEIDIADFMGSLENEEMKSYLYNICDREMIPDEVNEKAFRDCITKIVSSVYDEQKNAKRQEMTNYTDPLIKARLAGSAEELRKQKDELTGKNR
ncbi:MAG: DNA primase [Erysipelotrichaceae bacterium]|nr:DNA primase [Erysipelotrichaceae bacterium]